MYGATPQPHTTHMFTVAVKSANELSLLAQKHFISYTFN